MYRRRVAVKRKSTSESNLRPRHRGIGEKRGRQKRLNKESDAPGDARITWSIGRNADFPFDACSVALCLRGEALGWAALPALVQLPIIGSVTCDQRIWYADVTESSLDRENKSEEIPRFARNDEWCRG
jgi:hypothetical protein